MGSLRLSAAGLPNLRRALSAGLILTGLIAGLSAGSAGAAPLLWTYQGGPFEPTPLHIEVCGEGNCPPAPAPYTASLSIDPALVPGGSLAGFRYAASWMDGFSRSLIVTTSLGTETQSCDVFEGECQLDLPEFLDFNFGGFTPATINQEPYGDTFYSAFFAFDAAGVLSQWRLEVAGNYSLCNFGQGFSSGGGLCEPGAYDVYSDSFPRFASQAPGVWTGPIPIPAPVPLPASVLLLAGGLAVLALRRGLR